MLLRYLLWGNFQKLFLLFPVPFVIKRIGMKWALLVGMSMWGIRFIMFILAANGHMDVQLLGSACMVFATIFSYNQCHVY